MRKKRQGKTTPLVGDELTSLSSEELERRWEAHHKEWGIAHMKMAEIDRELNARRIGRPARQPWPWTEREKEDAAKDRLLYP